jgi:hypothetical protein
VSIAYRSLVYKNVGPITKTRSRDQTTSDIVNMTLNMISVLAKDNVQVSAILAFQSLGTTLPMALETRSTVKFWCSQDQYQGSALFLYALGYRRPGKWIWWLSQSDSGARFLGLAAALLTIGSGAASETLQTLIYDTIKNKEMVPTVPELEQIMEVLSTNYESLSKLLTSDIITWTIILAREQEIEEFGPAAPSPILIAKLVQSLADVFTIGNNERRKVAITASPAESAWIIVFVKWCTGLLPTVVSDRQHIIKKGTNLYVTVTVSYQVCRSQIVVLNEVGEINELVRELS